MTNNPPIINESREAASEDDLLILEEAVSFLEKTLYSKNPPPELSKIVHRKEKLAEILLDLIAIRKFMFAIANGDLSKKLTIQGYLGGALKMLQANLKHLTWQTQMIASGDLTQRVDFMGDFSKAFNDMVQKLEDARSNLEQKESELLLTNEALLREIDERKAIEQNLRKSEERYKKLSQTDSLTGIFNRRHFFALAEMAVKRAFRYKHPLAVLMLDIDFFKRVNDIYGHTMGDKVLQLISYIATKMLRSIDILARYGGEEFILLLPETDAAGALIAAERIRKKIENYPFVLDANSAINITVSIGLSADYILSPKITALEVLIERSDQALYEAKQTGRNRVCTYKCNQKCD